MLGDQHQGRGVKCFRVREGINYHCPSPLYTHHRADTSTGPHCTGGSRMYLFYSTQTCSEDKIIHLLLSLSLALPMTVLNALQTSPHSSSQPSLQGELPDLPVSQSVCWVSPCNLYLHLKEKGEGKAASTTHLIEMGRDGLLQWDWGCLVGLAPWDPNAPQPATP